jgi:hypothetical protein
MESKDTVGNLFLDHFVVRFICLCGDLEGRYCAIEYGSNEFAYILHLCVANVSSYLNVGPVEHT